MSQVLDGNPAQCLPIERLRCAAPRLDDVKQQLDFPIGIRVNQCHLELASSYVDAELLAKLAAQRFLPKPAQVPFPERKDKAETREPVTIDSVRKLLAELQLSGGDPDLVRSQRLRLEQLSEVMSRVNDPEALRRLQATLEALEVEVRGAF